MGTKRQSWSAWVRPEAWLTSLSDWSSPALFGGFLVWFVGWTFLVGIIYSLVVDVPNRPAVAAVAGQLTPAAGVLFALLTAFVITTHWNRTRRAEEVVGSEADAGLRLAMASQSPGIDGPGIRRHLADYLHTVLTVEWETLHRGRAGSTEAAEALAVLGRNVRADATATGIASAVTADVLAALEALAVARRDRLNLSGSGLPVPLFLLTFVSGVVLCLDAVAVVIDPVGWEAVLIAGLVVVVALDLALIVAISDAFRGPMQIGPLPIEAVLNDIETGLFGPVAVTSSMREQPTRP